MHKSNLVIYSFNSQELPVCQTWTGLGCIPNNHMKQLPSKSKEMRKLCLKAGFFLITCKLFNVIVKTVKKKLFSLKEKLISVFCDEVPMSPSLFLIEQDPSLTFEEEEEGSL